MGHNLWHYFPPTLSDFEPWARFPFENDRQRRGHVLQRGPAGPCNQQQHRARIETNHLKYFTACPAYFLIDLTNIHVSYPQQFLTIVRVVAGWVRF